MAKRGEAGMFRGATLVNLDSKGRLAVPTRYR
ncbi:cell division/cell wall cluster transcriptional repressor MraZ, partial [Klebsiella pneumoniae]